MKKLIPINNVGIKDKFEVAYYSEKLFENLDSDQIAMIKQLKRDKDVILLSNFFKKISGKNDITESIEFLNKNNVGIDILETRDSKNLNILSFKVIAYINEKNKKRTFTEEYFDNEKRI